MKQFLYRLGCLLLLITAVVGKGNATVKVLAGINHKICPGDTVEISINHSAVIWKDSTVYDTTYVVREDDVKDTIVTPHVVNTYPTYITNEPLRYMDRGVPFTWHTLPISKAGTYEKVFKTVDDCDSIFRVNVREKVVTYVPKYLCDGNWFYFGTQKITTGGTYTDTIRLGLLDSITVMTVNLVMPDTIVTKRSIPEGDSTKWEDNYYRIADTYDVVKPNRFGCDSVNRLILTVYHVDTLDTTASICPGTTLTWHGQTYGQTGTWKYPSTRPSGEKIYCILRLTVKKAVEVPISFRICNDETVTYNGKTYSEGGTYYDQITCDSTAVITVSKYASVLHATQAVLPAEGGYRWTFMRNGHKVDSVFYKPDTYEYWSVNEETGCKDTWRLILTKDESTYLFHQDLTICEGDDFVWQGLTNLSNTGVGTSTDYKVTYKTRAGKDSIYTLRLTVNPVVRTTQIIPFCESYTYKGQTYTTSQTILDTVKSIQGCDSILTIYLQKGRTFHRHDTATIVTGETLVWRGQTITTNGLYKDTYTAAGGCDSIYTLGVGMIAAVEQTKMRTWSETICENDTPFVWRKKEYTTSGIYVDTVKKGDEVDSLLVLKLTVNPSYNITKRITFHNFDENSTYDGYKFTYNGEKHVFKYHSASGCDSIVTVYADRAVYRTEDFAKICAGEKYTWGWDNRDYTVSGRYVMTIKDHHDKDSVEHILNLTVTNIPDTYITKYICKGSTYTFGDQVLSTTNVYTHTFKSGSCDSIVHLSLNVLNPDTNRFVHQMNKGDEYKWNDKFYYDAGTYYHYGTNRYGCDSVNILTITVNHVDTIDTVASVCPGTTMHWHGIHASQTGTFYGTEEQADGSYNYYRLKLTVREIKEINKNFTICAEESVTYNGKTYTEGGVFRDYIACDTVVVLHIKKYPQEVKVTQASLGGDTGFPWTFMRNGHKVDSVFYKPGTYEYRSTNAETGCPDIWRLILTKDMSEYHFVEHLTICEGDDFTWQGQGNLSHQYVDGLPHEYKAEYKTRNGQDSIYTLYLTVKPKKTSYRTVKFCGETMHKGQLITSSTTVYDTVTSSTGCDSIITIRYDKANSYLFKEYKELPQGKIYHWRGFDIMTDGVYTAAYTSVYGCDSIYELTVKIKPVSPQTNQYAEERSICAGDSTFWRKHWRFAGGTYIDTVKKDGKVDSIFTLTLTVHPSYKNPIVRHLFNCNEKGSIYYMGQLFYKDTAVVDTFSSIHGCDSIEKVYMHFGKTASVHDTVRIAENKLPYVWKPNNDTTFNLITPGTHTYEKETAGECMSHWELYLEIYPVFHYEDSVAVCEGDLPYKWLTGPTEHRNDNLSGPAGQTTRIIYNYTTTKGADSTFLLKLYVLPQVKHIEQITMCEGESMTLPNGHTYFNLVADSIYRDTVAFPNPKVPGCDSIVFYEIQQHAALTKTETKILRKDSTIEWHGQEITSGGTYYDVKHGAAAGGCDSTYYLKVIQEQPHEASICVVDTPYTWYINDHTYQLYTSGLWTDTVRGADGHITQFHTLDLHVNVPIEKDTVLRGCQQNGVTWNGFTYSKDTTFRDTLITCDTIFQVKIKVDTTYMIEVKDTVCETELPYIFGRQNPDTIWEEVRNRPHTDITACGCDSTVYLTLYIIPDLKKNDSTFICEDEIKKHPVVLGDTIDPWFEHREGGKYSGLWQGKWHGVAYTTDTMVWNCSKTYFHHIIVRPSQKVVKDTILYMCPGDSVRLFLEQGDDTTWFYKDTLYEQHTPMPSTWTDGKHQYHYNNDSYSCDSITRWHIFFHQPYHKDTTAHILLGDSIWWNGFYRFETGVYGDTLAPSPDTTSFGDTCMYEKKLYLYVDTAYHYTDTIFSLCTEANKEYKHIWESGYEQKFVVGTKDEILHSYSDTLKTVTGPDKPLQHDSIYELFVTYSIIKHKILYDTLCYGDSIQFDQHSYQMENTTTKERYLKKAGIYVDTLRAENGCDSIVEMRLYVRNRIDTTILPNVSIVDRELPYVWKHNWKTREGGAQSRVDSLFIGGTYRDTLTSYFGCDSVVQLTLSVRPTYLYKDTVDTCAPINTTLTHYWPADGNIPAHTQEYQTPSTDKNLTYGDTLVINHPFDSVFYYLYVRYHRTYETHYYDTICAGDSTQIQTVLSSHPDRYYKTTGIYHDTVPSYFGCDSVITLHLQVWPKYPTTHHSVDIADVDTPYLWIHTWMENAELQRDTDSLYIPGEYALKLPTIHGCDSVDSLSLRIHKTYNIQLPTITICESDTDNFPYKWEDKTEIRKSGDYSYKTQTHDGYDSIRNVHITILPILYDTIRAWICEGDSMRFGLKKDGTPLFVSKDSVYRDTVISYQYGCDSIATLYLNVWPKYYHDSVRHIADTDTPYVWIHRKGGAEIARDSLYYSGAYEYKFKSNQGCDSIDSLHLFIHKTYRFEKDTTICESETPFTWHDYNGIMESGTYFYNPHTHDGYDSLYVLNLTVNKIKHTILVDSICSDKLPFDFRGRALTKGGIYIDSTHSAQGCDSIIELHLTVNEPYYHYYRADIYEDQLPYKFLGETCTQGGTFKHISTTPNGCDSITEVMLVVHKLIDTTAVVCSNDMPFAWRNHYTGDTTWLYSAGIYHNDTTLDATGERTFWSIELKVENPKFDTTRVSICEGSKYIYKDNVELTKAGVYRDTLRASNGCDSIHTLILTVNKPYYYRERVDIYEDQLPYKFLTETYTEGGTFKHINTTPEGCDSISELMLVVHKLVDTTAVVCSNNMPFAWRNHWTGDTIWLYSAGIYHNDTTLDANGERTFWSIELKVEEPQFDTTRVSICEGNEYVFNNVHLSKAGIYRDTLRGKNGCDSIHTLILTVNKPYYREIIEDVLEGQEVEFFGNTYSTSDTYKHTSHTPEGCDSTTILTLRVHPLFDSIAYTCFNQMPYVWYNRWSGNKEVYHSAGIIRNDTTINGEKRFFGLKLVVNQETYDTISASICEGESYAFGPLTCDTSGTYNYTVTGKNGCDSIRTLHLTVKPQPVVVVKKSIFRGDTLEFEKQKFAEPGIYEFTRKAKNAEGCDTIVELQLTVNNIYDDSVTVCYNELPYKWQLKSDPTKYMEIYKSAVYRDTLYDSNGEMTVTGIKVTVLPIITDGKVVNKTICEGDIYTFGLTKAGIPRTLTEGGTYYDTVTSYQYGCDSIVKLVLTVQPVVYQTETQTIFEGDTIFFYGDTLTTAGIYEHREKIPGSVCFDKYQLILKVVKPLKLDTTAYVCENELPFHWRDHEYQEAGDYTLPVAWTDTSRVTITLHLKINPIKRVEQMINICAGDTFIYKGHRFYDSGDFYDTIPMAHGCDSITRFIVRKHPTYDKIIEKHVSDKEPYDWNGRILTISGTYEWTGKTIHGCDSMQHLILTVHPSFLETDSIDLCKSDTLNYPYKWHGQTIEKTGTYWDSTLTVYGFDSVYKLVVTVHPSYMLEEQYEIGYGEVLKIHGRDISKPAIYYDTLRTIHGCDSVFHIVINQKRVKEFTWNYEICQSNPKQYPYDFFGRKLTHTGTYTYTSIYKDSVVTLNLTVNPVSISEKRIVIADTKNYYTYDGKLYENLNLGDNLFADTLSNQYGCDSIKRLIINVTKHYSAWTPVPLCPGSEVKIDDQVITKSGLYTFVRRSYVTGEMDSLYRVEVYDAPAYEYDIARTICEGDTLFFKDSAIVITRGGHHDVVLKTKEGCDSVFHLDLTVNPSYHFYNIVTTRDFEPYIWMGKSYFTTGVYNRSYPTYLDCDSTYTLDLRVVPTLRDTVTETICTGQTFNWRGKQYDIDGYYTDTVWRPEASFSAIYSLRLNVAYPTTITSARTGDICADAESFDIQFEYSGHKPTYYSVYFDQLAKREGFEDVINAPFGADMVAHVKLPQFNKVAYQGHPYYVRPDYYTVRLALDNGVCGINRSDSLRLLVKYPSWILEQNWNDVVAPLKSEYNGGYEFSQMEWYINDVKQQNTTMGYLQSSTLLPGDQVVMMATRRGESVAIPTCPLIIKAPAVPTYETPVIVYPTQAPKHMPTITVEAPQEGKYEVYSSTGLLIESGRLEEGKTSVTLPAINGIYFIRTFQGRDAESHKVILY